MLRATAVGALNGGDGAVTPPAPPDLLALPLANPWEAATRRALHPAHWPRLRVFQGRVIAWRARQVVGSCGTDVHRVPQVVAPQPELARRGSLSAKARQLKADHSTVARRIASLEAALGMKLFDRMPRGYLLTREGEGLLERAGAMEDAAHAIERLAAGRSDRIDGVLRISAPPTFASRWLVPRLAPLRRTHPGLALDVVGQAVAADPVRRDADIGCAWRGPKATRLSPASSAS